MLFKHLRVSGGWAAESIQKPERLNLIGAQLSQARSNESPHGIAADMDRANLCLIQKQPESASLVANVICLTGVFASLAESGKVRDYERKVAPEVRCDSRKIVTVAAEAMDQQDRRTFATVQIRH
jgi:hypothetical protein